MKTPALGLPRVNDLIDEANPVANHPLNRGLVYWYLASAKPQALTWYDLMGNVDGVLTNKTAADWSSGKGCPQFGLGGVLAFNGGTEVVTASQSLIADKPVTFAASFYANVHNIKMGLIEIQESTSSYISLRVDGTFGGNPVRMHYRSTGASTAALTTTGYIIGQWHHAVGVVDGSANIAAFLDGGGKGAASGSGTTNALDTIFLGDTLIEDNLDGGLSDCRVYNRVLSDGEVLQLYTEARLGYPNLLNRTSWLVPAVAPAAGGLSIPIAAYHQNFHNQP